MAARKTTKTQKKLQYVRAKKRKGAEPTTMARRSISIILLLLIVGGILFGIKTGLEWIGGKLYAENPRFEIQHLVISCDGKLPEDYIRETSGLREGMNLWELSFPEIEENLLSVSRIESVYLERQLPHTLIVKVKERVPVARITGKRVTKYPFMVDRYGYVLPHRRSLASLPLIQGLDMDDIPLGEPLGNVDVDTALQIIGICESSGYLRNYVQLESLDLKYSDFIDMRLTGSPGKPIRVRMPRFSLKPKLQNLATVIKIANGQGRRVKEVDLTLDSAKVPVTYY
ncbi:FtsQ-type POTRA domain-containing protein [Pontiellaceae bacterium B12219]|nr:FtsQ-type POTRA domain-containing protein [Pontiellaceae bacterium B12219]